MSSSDTSPVPAKKLKGARGKGKEKADKNRKIWTKEELVMMAEFVVHINGKVVPRANFIRDMIKENKWTMTGDQVGNKWDLMYRQYVETVKWKNQTGQGVKDSEGEDAFHDLIIRKCPQFDILDPVLGTKVSVKAPAVVQSDPPTIDVISDNEELLDLEKDGIIENEQEKDDNEGVAAINKPSSSSTATGAAKIFRKSLNKSKLVNSQLPKSGQERIALSYERKTEVEEKKLEIFKNEINLKREEFEQKKKNDEENIKLKKFQIESKSKQEFMDSNYRYKLEVAKLTQDPELMKALIKDCMNVPNQKGPEINNDL